MYIMIKFLGAISVLNIHIDLLYMNYYSIPVSGVLNYKKCSWNILAKGDLIHQTQSTYIGIVSRRLQCRTTQCIKASGIYWGEGDGFL